MAKWLLRKLCDLMVFPVHPITVGKPLAEFSPVDQKTVGNGDAIRGTRWDWNWPTELLRVASPSAVPLCDLRTVHIKHHFNPTTALSVRHSDDGLTSIVGVSHSCRFCYKFPRLSITQPLGTPNTGLARASALRATARKGLARASAAPHTERIPLSTHAHMPHAAEPHGRAF
mgnify:CR=1 FL=1